MRCRAGAGRSRRRSPWRQPGSRLVRRARGPQHPRDISLRGLPRHGATHPARPGAVTTVAPAGGASFPRQVVLAGARALDPAELAFVESEGIRTLSVQALREPDRLISAVAGTGATHVYIHLDLDVLDPEHFPSLSCPEPGGLHPEQLRAALRALAERFHLAGLGVTEHAPAADSAGSDQVLQGILDRLAIP
ncbi:arginase family protein [Streptomyces echinatus]|uniref:arginase family protein n=1 Tax=Streptomyces echinatus TaxID=67293 RepID=UPI0035EA065F